MRWQGRQGSDNVDDRRSGGGGRVMVGGGIGTIVIVVIALLLGKNPMQLLQNFNGGQVSQQTSAPAPANDKEAQFASVVLKETETVWTTLFAQMGKQYEKPRMVLFSNNVQSGCGSASSSTGPFYCPADNSVYLDLTFFNELSNRFNAAGDFASAYVIAHEVGHHVQNILGISDKVHRMQQNADEAEANALSVRLELQADFLAGVWAHYADKKENIIEAGDIDEALNAASAIGDDRLQMQAQGRVVPDAFTHGTSAQRVKWFRKGYESGDVNQMMGTFEAANP
jgi:hypothetical protein